MAEDRKEEADQKKSALGPSVIFSFVLLILYPLSIPFYYLLGLSLPVWMHDYYILLWHIYAPIEWLYFNVESVKAFYDWYEQFFPWWQ
jgi:hypothetical protein